MTYLLSQIANDYLEYPKWEQKFHTFIPILALKPTDQLVNSKFVHLRVLCNNVNREFGSNRFVCIVRFCVFAAEIC